MSNMSGVVVKLNDDEASEDEDDTGLLPVSRGYDDDDDDMDDFDEDGDTANGSRHKSRGRSVLKRLRGNKKIPYPALRSGTVMQLLNTLTICCIFFGMVRNLKIFTIKSAGCATRSTLFCFLFDLSTRF